MDVRLVTLLVIHNRACEQSPSCEALFYDVHANAVIVDNSTQANNNASYCAARGFGYVSLGGNLGLAVAYNRGIAWIRDNTDATHVMLLDDDTSLPEGYVEQVIHSVCRHPNANIYLPRVFDEKGLLSPCAIDGLRVRRIGAVQELTPNNITGINSGMVVDMRLFDRYTYDEGYFLDYIDHAFLRDMKAMGATVTVTKQELRQSFADNVRGNKRAAKTRFRIFKKDFRRFCGRSFKGRLTALAVTIKRRIKIALSA